MGVQVGEREASVVVAQVRPGLAGRSCPELVRAMDELEGCVVRLLGSGGSDGSDGRVRVALGPGGSDPAEGPRSVGLMIRFCGFTPDQRETDAAGTTKPGTELLADAPEWTGLLAENC